MKQNRLMLTQKEIDEVHNHSVKTGNEVGYHQAKANEALRKYMYHTTCMNNSLTYVPAYRQGRDYQRLSTYVGPEQVIITYDYAVKYDQDSGKMWTNAKPFLAKDIRPLLVADISTWDKRPPIYKVEYSLRPDNSVREKHDVMLKEDIVKDGTHQNSFE